MKRIYFFIILLMLFGSLVAELSHLALFDARELVKSDALTLRESVHNLHKKGLELYHYNEGHILAGIPRAKSSFFLAQAKSVFPLPYSGTLYLVSRLDAAPIEIPQSCGELIFDMEDAVLIRSDLNVVSFREQIPYPFSELELIPLRFAPDGLKMEDCSHMRTDLDQMLSLVSHTSVQNMMQGLEDFVTRYALGENRLVVANWIKNKYLSFGISDVQLFPFQWNNTTQYNVVATIQGSVYPDQYILVGGHHDSINQHGDPYLSAPGADDNASGAVATLEMARVMMQSGFVPRCSIRFMTFAAEEFGLWGSKAYAQYALDNELDIRLMINHDMIANNYTPQPNWRVMLMPYDGSLEHNAYVSQITQQYTTLGTFNGYMNSNSSDSYPFWQRGYHVVYFFEEDFSPHYHSSDDLVINTDPLYAAEIIKASTAVASLFANMPSAPSGLSVIDGGDGQRLVLQWDEVNDPQLAGYRIYCGTELNNLNLNAEVTDSSYIITGLTQGQPYYIGLSSFDTFGNESYWVYGSGVPFSIPQAPQGFGQSSIPNAIRLFWDANNEWDMAHYQIFRSTGAGETGTLISTIPHTQLEYIDSNVSGGLHYYYYSLKAVDGDGHASDASLQIRSRPMTLDRGILIVDETKDLSGANPFQPTDEQADLFYAQAMQEFDFDELDLEELYLPLDLCDIGIYSSILWHGNDQAEMDYPFFVRDILKEYISQGGNILFSVYYPSLAFELNSDYPHSFTPDSFINEVFGIGAVDYTTQARFKRANPNGSGFPELEADPQKTLTNLLGHIMKIEGMSSSDNATEIYFYDSDYEDDSPQGHLNNMSVGIYKEYGSGKVFTLSFPLYNIMEHQAGQLCYHVFHNVFGELSSSEDPVTPELASLILEAPWPNPFSGMANISLKVRDLQEPLSIKIYNQRGQLVRKLHDGMALGHISLIWDGKDEAGRKAGSGIYLVRAAQKDRIAVRKIVLIR